MTDPSSMSPQELYRQWRSGDAMAGQAMAQRFSDWYYSLVSVRMGDVKGRAPLQKACQRFQQGITAVNSPGELVDWAHALVAEEMKAAGERVDGGDFPNQLTGGKSPSELIRLAAKTLPPEDVALLAATFDPRVSVAALSAQAEARGGMPLAILKARYALKHALREQAGVPLQEVPASPNLDYAPLPLYEAGRMAGSREESTFEKWVLSNMTICRDVAEFGTFTLALRGGALRAAGQVAEAPRPSEPRVVSPPAEPGIAARSPIAEAEEPAGAAAAPARSGMSVVMVAGVAGALVAAVVLAVVLYFLLK
jgi:hypothetical protein